MNEISKNNDNFALYTQIRSILLEARVKAYTAVNFAMVQFYWQIGKLIVEDELGGNIRGEYGKRILQNLSDRLTAEFGAGFDVSNLRKMRNFYELFRKQDALRPELTWTHYRLLLKVKDENARNWYIEELQMELDRNRRFLLENKRN
jgi:hypothetical protein